MQFYVHGDEDDDDEDISDIRDGRPVEGFRGSMMASMSMMVVMTMFAIVMKTFKVTSDMVAPSRGFGVTERFFWHHSNSSEHQTRQTSSIQGNKIKPSKMEVAPQGCLQITNKKTINQIN